MVRQRHLLALSCELKTKHLFSHDHRRTVFPLSLLRHSSIRSTFSSYLTTAFTLSNFLFLAHATVTSEEGISPPPLCSSLPCSLIIMNGVGTCCSTDAMVDAVPCVTHMSPNTEHLHPPLRWPIHHVHHHDSHHTSLLRRISSDVRGSRGISLWPHGHPVVDIRPSGSGGHPLRCPAH